MAGPYALDDLAHYFGLALEDVPRTAQPPELFIPFTGDAVLEHGMESDEVWEGGTGPYQARSVKTRHKPNGTFTHPLKPSTTAALLAWFLGDDQVAAAGSLFDHTSIPDQPPIYLTTEWNAAGASDLVERVGGCVLSKLVISSPEGNGEVTAAWTWAGSTPAKVASPTAVTYEAGMHGATPGAAFRPSDCTYTLDNATVTNIASWEMTIDWGIDDNIFTSTWTRAAILKNKMTVELKVKFLELTADQYKKVNYGSTTTPGASVADFLDGTATSWRAAYTNSLATTNLRTLSLTIPQVQWKAAPRKLTAEGGTSFVEMTGIARKPAGAIITAVSRNMDTLAYC
jgi:hypothetical protein